MPFSLPHSQFSEHFMSLVIQLRENMSAIIAGMDERVVGRVETIPKYTATGDPTTRITIPARQKKKAFAVMLVRAHPAQDPSADLPIAGHISFTQNVQGISTPEPSGLVAGDVYSLTYLILE